MFDGLEVSAVACVFRVVGRSFDVLAFMKGTTLTVDKYYRDRLHLPRAAGVPIDPTQPPLATRQGLNVIASHASMADVASQIRDCTEFLSSNAPELRRLRRFAGVDSMCLDFAIRWRDVAAQTDTFPASLLTLMADLGIDLVVSHYPVSEPDAATE